MFDAIKADNARYAGFAACMLQAEAHEAADTARIEAGLAPHARLIAANVDSAAATVAPRKVSR